MTQVAVVSGCSYGLGAAISQKLLDKQFKVYGISRTPPKINHSHFVWLQADLTSTKDINSLPHQISENSLDLLINNVGTAIHEDVLNYLDENFDKIFQLNFIAPIKLTLKLFSKLAHGLIINTSSLSDRFPDGLYGSSKAALNNYFDTIAQENHQVKIISMLPGYIDTPLLRQLHPHDPPEFWDKANSPQQTAEFISYIIDHPLEVESGGRVIVISSNRNDGDFDPEKLWLFLTDKKQLTRLK